MRRTTWIVALTLLPTILNSVSRADRKPVAAARPVDLSTPKSAAKTFRQAFGSGKWRRGFRTVTPESRELLLGYFVLHGQAKVKDEPKREQRFREILEDHGLEDLKLKDYNDVHKNVRGKFDGVDDKAKLFGILVNFRHDNEKPGARPDGSGYAAGIRRIKFTDFKVKRHFATAKYGNGALTMMFCKVKGRWYVDFAFHERGKGR